jgi:hypothetical protein
MVGLAAAAFFYGAGDGHMQMAEAAPHKPRAWFDAKGAFVFPLGKGPLPQTREQLAAALKQGWSSSLRFPEGGDIVQATGGRYPAIGSLHIKLDGGISNPDPDDSADPPLKPSGKVESRISIRDFSLTADPLVSEKAKMSVFISATDARMEMEHDDQNRPMIMLSDAREASFRFEASNADLERMIVLDLNEAGKKYGVKVKKAQLKVTATNDRSLDVDLHLSTLVALIPAGMRFQAHVDIDDDMFAKLSHLKCDGDEALGFLIVGLIRPGLAKYEGKSRAVFSFPTGELELRDVKIQGGDEVKISAKFAR